ncbi:hypothetical protein PQR62_19735 [Herbaspirillum lusitanum]|uniref:Fimbrial assembly protein n=1 Tax=Herbaspirillum lusitanum TaxID=213312 RepID=A0ABW9AC85_9BURK
MSASLNFLPHRLHSRRRRELHFYRQLACAAALGIVIIAAIGALQDRELAQLKELQQILALQNSELDGRVKDAAAMRAEIRQQDIHIQSLRALNAQRASASGLLLTLARITPEHLYLRSVHMTGRELTLGGQAEDSPSVEIFGARLSAAGFRQVHLLELRALNASAYEFRLSAGRTNDEANPITAQPEMGRQ